MEGEKKRADVLNKEIRILVQKREASVKDMYEKNNIMETKEKKLQNSRRN